MSWAMAAIYDWFMSGLEEACGTAWRTELLEGVSGRVLEVGAGTGRNLDFYRLSPASRLVLAEPDRHMRGKLEPRVRELRARTEADIEVVPWTAERLEADDASFDVVVATLVLCSVSDVATSLREIRRVLAPSGTLVFLEHVAATDRGRLGWQRRVEPGWKLLAGNCHLCRDTERSILDAGFQLDRITRESARKALPIIRATIRGHARAPSS